MSNLSWEEDKDEPKGAARAPSGESGSPSRVLPGSSPSPSPAPSALSGGSQVGSQVGSQPSSQPSSHPNSKKSPLALPAPSPPRSSSNVNPPDPQAALFPERYRQMCVLGVILVSLFYIIDVYYPWPRPQVTLDRRQFFGIRALWVATYILLLSTSYFREHNRVLQIIRDYILVGLTSGMVGILCAHTGRMASPYYGGIIILVLARFVLIPGNLFRVAPVSVFMLAAWMVATCAWPSPFPRPGLEGWKGVTTLAFILGAMLPGMVGTVNQDRLALGLETAKLMGRYRLSRRIGAGGMGEVHLAYHASLRRPCAVKILKADLGDAVAAARFEREAEAASRLRHPNTIAVFDFGRTETGQPYYVMEYLDGCDLGQLVRREGALLPEHAVYLLEQAAGSLAEAHAQGMIHRDVKPGNLFVTTMGGHGDFIKVLDFGLVKGVDLGPDLTRQDAFMGTPRYMAPEALSGQTVDCRVDVYALGAVAYFALCGEPPFASGDAYLDIYRQIHDPPPPISTRRDPKLPAPSEALIAVVFKCLEKDRNKRFANAGEILAALEQTPEHGRHRPPVLPVAPGRPDERASRRSQRPPSADSGVPDEEAVADTERAPFQKA